MQMRIGRPAYLGLLVLALTPGLSAARERPAPPAAATPASAPDTTDEDVAEGASPAPSSTDRRPPSTYGRLQVDTSGTPVTVEQTGRSPDRPLTPYDMSYDARLRASSAASEGLLGPLEGGWRLALDGGGDAYAFALSDRDGQVEGAWRDLRRGGANASGFVDDIQRLDATIPLRFQAAAGPVVATLTARPDGRWTGELTDGTGHRAATLRRAPSAAAPIEAGR